MKKYVLLILISVSFFSCEKTVDDFVIENDPFTIFPTTISRNVMVETFCGEWSDDNERTSRLLDSMYINSDYRIFPVKYHDNDWLETGYTAYQRNFLGGRDGVSIGSINREPAKSTTNNENDYILMSSNNWAYNSFRQLNDTPPFGIALNTSLHDNNTLNIDVYIAQTAAVEETTRILFYLVQNNINPIFQKNASAEFKHNYVYMSSYPDQVGYLIDQQDPMNNGKIKKLSYSGIDLSQVNTANTKVVVLIYKENADYTKRQVINVQSCNIGGARIWQ
jgi:hypothetical protein